MVMLIAGREIDDTCIKCGELLQCELFLQGHGIKRERENVTEMVKCQMKHLEDADRQKGTE